MSENEPETPKPRVATPEEAAEAAEKYDFTAEETDEAVRKQIEEEERKGRELFGDGPRFPIPDADTDS